MVWSEANNGKPVDYIDIGVGQEGYRVNNTSEKPNGIALIFEYSFHGDYDEGWVVELSALDAREIRRHNARHITTIKWLL